MDQNLENYELRNGVDNIKAPKSAPKTRKKSNRCNQCEYASPQAGHLRTHLKIHSGERPIKCNQCDYASSRTGDLRQHLKTHSGEK